MIPLLPFAAGLVAGGLLVRLMRDEKTQAGVKKAQQSVQKSVRSAADSGLAMLKTSSATVKRMLWSEDADGAGQPSAAAKKKTAARRKKPVAAAASATPDAATPARKAAARKRAAAKAAKPAATEQDTQA